MATLTTHLDPLVSRLFHGVVVFSKSWRGDLWLYLKNEHIVLSMFAAHPDHPFSKYDRTVVTCISVIVAYGLDCCFMSTGSPTTAFIMSMTIGVVVQSLFGEVNHHFAALQMNDDPHVVSITSFLRMLRLEPQVFQHLPVRSEGLPEPRVRGLRAQAVPVHWVLFYQRVLLPWSGHPYCGYFYARLHTTEIAKLKHHTTPLTIPPSFHAAGCRSPFDQ